MHTQIIALLAVLVLSGLAGLFVGLLDGYDFKGWWIIHKWKLKPILKEIVIPPLLGMILMGCIVRNFFGDFMRAYPEPWTKWLDSCTLGILMTRGGMQVSFKGQGLVVVLVAIFPTLIEGLTCAGVAYQITEMPIELCFVLAYCLANTAASILVP